MEKVKQSSSIRNKRLQMNQSIIHRLINASISWVDPSQSIEPSIGGQVIAPATIRNWVLDSVFAEFEDGVEGQRPDFVGRCIVGTTHYGGEGRFHVLEGHHVESVDIELRSLYVAGWFRSKGGLLQHCKYK